MKVQFKDGLYTWASPSSNTKKVHNGVEAPAGMEWQKLEITERIFNGADCYPWRRTFALWPVRTISGRYVWLCTVYKQRFWAVWGRGYHMEPEVEYAELFDILNEDSVG